MNLKTKVIITDYRDYQDLDTQENVSNRICSVERTIEQALDYIVSVKPNMTVKQFLNRIPSGITLEDDGVFSTEIRLKEVSNSVRS